MDSHTSSKPAKKSDSEKTGRREKSSALFLDISEMEESDFAAKVLEAMRAFQSGNFNARLPVDWTGVYGKIADTFNEVVVMNESRMAETTRVSYVVGKEGKLKQRMNVPGLVGGWADEVQAL